MTARSVFLLAAATVVLAAGLATGSAVYYMAALGMYGVWLGGLLSALITLFCLRVRPITRSVRVTRGETAAVRVSVGPGGWIPAGETLLEVGSPLSEPDSGTMTISPPAFGKKEYRYLMLCPHRGEGWVEFTALRVQDIFRLFSFRRRLKDARVLLTVYPGQRDAEPLILEPGDTGVESRARATEDAASPADVRQWQDGDSLKKIHWKLSLRKHELMVRTYEESMRSDTLILPDACAPELTRSARLYSEDALCECALAAVEAQLREDHPVRLAFAGSQPFEMYGSNAEDYPAFLQKLAGAVFDGQYPYEQYLAVEMGRLQRTGAVILITTRFNAVLAEAALRMNRMRIRVSYLWICDMETEEDVELLARLRMEGVKVERIDPWEGAA